MTCRARTDRRYIRDAYRSNRYVLIEMTAPEASRKADREPLNLAFVLDRSGSMTGQKIDLAKQAITQGIRSLNDADRFSVVAYDDVIDVIIESQPATPAARNSALQQVSRIQARNGTNLFEGWLRGCEQVAAHLAARDVNRALLLSDGLANIGVTDVTELERHATELRRRGVASWTFGVGADFDHQLLERMAVAGGGQSYFIEHPQQIPDYITGAVGEALDIVLRDVRIDVRASEGVLVEPLSRFVHRAASDGTVIEAGDLVSGQHLEVVLCLNFPFGAIGERRTATIAVHDRDGVHQHHPTVIDWEYADHRTNDAQPRDVEVDRAVARLYAARAQQEAARFNQEGSLKLAMQSLWGVANRVRGYAGEDPEMLAIIDDLERARHTVSRPMAPMAVKQMHFQNSYALRSRDAQGKARKE